MHGCTLYIFKIRFRYDPLAGLPTDTDTEQDRVIFIKSIAQFMVRKFYTNILCADICSIISVFCRQVKRTLN